MVDEIKRKIAEVRALVDKVRTLLNGRERPDRDVLAKARWELSSTAMQAMAKADRYFLAKMAVHERPHIRALAQDHYDEMQGMLAAFSQSAQYWDVRRIEADWDRFVVACHVNLDNVVHRLHRVESEILPLIANGSIEFGEPAPPTENWTRDAFAIKDVMTGKKKRS